MATPKTGRAKSAPAAKNSPAEAKAPGENKAPAENKAAAEDRAAAGPIAALDVVDDPAAGQDIKVAAMAEGGDLAEDVVVLPNDDVDVDVDLDVQAFVIEANDGVEIIEQEGLQEPIDWLFSLANDLLEPVRRWLLPGAGDDEMVEIELRIEDNSGGFVAQMGAEESVEEEEDDGLTRQQRAEAQAQAAFEIGAENFDLWIYNMSGGRERAAKRIEEQRLLLVDSYRRLFGLNDDQVKKLEICGRGDMSRFEQQVEQVRAKFMAVRKDQERFNHIWNDIGPLQQRMQGGFFHEQSLIAKSIPDILVADQLAKYRQWQDERRRFNHVAKIELVIAELEQYVPLTVEQRAKVVQLIVDAGPPAKKRGQFDQILVMYNMSLVTDAQWLAVIDKRQFDVINKLRQQGRQYGQILRQNRVID